MVERKQDALSTNFLLGLMDDDDQTKGELRVDVRKAPKVKGDQSISHLANRIVDEVRVTTPRQRAQKVLDNAGLSPQSNVTRTYNNHLQHVGERARKIPLNQEPVRKVRRVKQQSEPVRRRSMRSGPPSTTRTRPATGMEDEVRRSARDASNSRGKRRKRRSFLRRS